MDKIPLSLRFFRLSRPRSLSPSSQERCSSPSVIFMALHWTLSSPCLFCTGEPRTGPRTPGKALPVLRGEEKITSIDMLTTLPKAAHDTISLPCRKGTLLTSVLTNAQLSVQQDSKVFFCRAAFQKADCQPVLMPGVVPSQAQDLALVELQTC